MSKNVKKAPGNGVRFGSASSVCHFLPCERDFGESPEDAGNALVCLLLLYQEHFPLMPYSRQTQHGSMQKSADGFREAGLIFVYAASVRKSEMEK